MGKNKRCITIEILDDTHSRRETNKAWITETMLEKIEKSKEGKVPCK